MAKFFLYSNKRIDVNIVFGPSFAKKIKGKFQFKGIPNLGPNNEFAESHDFDAGIILGADFGLNFSKGQLIFAPRYYLGLTKIEGQLKNRVFSFLLGYSI